MGKKMKRSNNVISMNSEKQLPDLQAHWDKCWQELLLKFKEYGVTEISEQDMELPLKKGTLVVTFPPNRKVPVSGQWVSVSVPSGYEEATIIIGPINWKRIREGKRVDLKSRGWNDGEGFTLYWGFNTTAQSPLWVSYGDADAYRGSLSGATVEPVNKPTKK